MTDETFIGCARSTLNVLFDELVREDRRITALIDRARKLNPDDPRIKRAEACGEIVQDRLCIWLDRWEPAEPPN
jgi:hypothetical protein